MNASLKHAQSTLGDIDRRERSLDNLLKTLQQGMDIEYLKVAGSVSKGTDIKGLSDVDVLAYLGDTYEGLTSSQVRRIMKRVLERRYPEADIRVGDMAITLRIGGTEYQILPVKRAANGKLIVPSGDGKGWSKPTDQDRFKKKLESVSRRYGLNPSKMKGLEPIRMVESVIKEIKLIESTVSNKEQLSGYYIEASVVNYLGTRESTKGTLSELVKECYRYMAVRVLSPTPEKSGQSEYIDEDLGPRLSPHRRETSDRLRRTMHMLDQNDWLADTLEVNGRG